MKKWFDQIDTNKDGLIDRCEDARFLYAIGNTEEYSLNYGGYGSLLDLQKYCDFVVPDAFDAIAEEAKAAGDDGSLFAMLAQFWPFDMILSVLGLYEKPAAVDAVPA